MFRICKEDKLTPEGTAESNIVLTPFPCSVYISNTVNKYIKNLYYLNREVTNSNKSNIKH